MRCGALWFAVVLVAACTPVPVEDADAGADPVNEVLDCDGRDTPPILELVSDELQDGWIEVDVLDDDGVNTVQAYYRTGAVDFGFVFMTGSGTEDRWGGTVPAGFEGPVEVFIQATDGAECQATARLPEDAPDSWLTLENVMQGDQE